MEIPYFKRPHLVHPHLRGAYLPSHFKAFSAASVKRVVGKATSLVILMVISWDILPVVYVSPVRWNNSNNSGEGKTTI